MMRFWQRAREVQNIARRFLRQGGRRFIRRLSRRKVACPKGNVTRTRTIGNGGAGGGVKGRSILLCVACEGNMVCLGGRGRSR